MSNTPETPETPEVPQEEAQLTPEQEKALAEQAARQARQQRSRQKSVVFYIGILFAAAFLLLAMSFAMERRQNAEDMDDLNQSLSGLKDSVSAMQSVQKLYEENTALLERVAELEEDLARAEEQRNYLADKVESQEAEKGVLQNSVQALDWFWQINEAYVRGRYATCRELIAQLEESGFVENLPRVSVTDNGRFSPYDRYKEICDALS